MKSSEPEFISCSICHVTLNSKRLTRHMRKAHFLDEQGNLIPRVRGLIPHSITATTSSQPKQELCPVCNGDGGVRGGCYKCDGSGWVSSAARASFFGSTAPSAPRINSRFSNVDYAGNNAGAHFRDPDGRIGSHPDHDDYSENGQA